MKKELKFRNNVIWFGDFKLAILIRDVEWWYNDNILLSYDVFKERDSLIKQIDSEIKAIEFLKKGDTKFIDLSLWHKNLCERIKKVNFTYWSHSLGRWDTPCSDLKFGRDSRFKLRSDYCINDLYPNDLYPNDLYPNDLYPEVSIIKDYCVNDALLSLAEDIAKDMQISNLLETKKELTDKVGELESKNKALCSYIESAQVANVKFKERLTAVFEENLEFLERKYRILGDKESPYGYHLCNLMVETRRAICELC